MTDIDTGAEAVAKRALGIEWRDTESAARRVAESASEEIQALTAELTEARAQVAAAYEAAATVAACQCQCRCVSLDAQILALTPALTPADATAALEARDARIRAEEREQCARVAESHTTQRLIYINPENRKRDEDMVSAIRKGGE